jgi:hypothetical protein
VLSASGAPQIVQSFLASDLTLARTHPTGPYPIAVTTSSDGASFAAGADASYDEDVFVFPVGDTTQVRCSDFDSTSKELVAGGLAFSPDASRLFMEQPQASKACSSEIRGFERIAAEGLRESRG